VKNSTYTDGQAIPPARFPERYYARTKAAYLVIRTRNLTRTGQKQTHPQSMHFIHDTPLALQSSRADPTVTAEAARAFLPFTSSF